MRKRAKNLGFILIVLSHYYFCGYVLSEVHNVQNYEPLTNTVYNVNEEKISSNFEAVYNDYYECLAILNIPKINLSRCLYDIDSKENNVNKNVEVLKASSMPDVKGGNLILAGHNGNSSVGYFKNLHKLSLGDEIIIEYEGIKYVYEVEKMYDVLKTGSVAIKRDKTKDSITLITCLGSDRQLVVIGYLKNKV